MVPNRTALRKSVWKIEDYTTEPDSKAQCMALEENVKEFGLTYFGIKDRRQGTLAYRSHYTTGADLIFRYCAHHRA